jgi:hypothetical protein
MAQGSKQKTQPKKGKPIEIPIPTRKEVFDFMRGVTGKRPSGSGGAKQK